MKVTPISYVDEMVRPLLSGQKKQTRRVVKPSPEPGTNPYHIGAGENMIARSCPYGKTGDLLWVRESAEFLNAATVDGRVQAVKVRYSADGIVEWIEYPERLAPNPNVGQFMANGCYREASRITLCITNTRIERLQEISEADAKKEGVDGFDVDSLSDDEINLLDAPVLDRSTPYINGFSLLWNGLAGYDWGIDPLVWVIEFRVVKMNVDALIAGATDYSGRSV
jgi:hypothetical protein